MGPLAPSGRRVLRRPVIPVHFSLREEGTPLYQLSRGSLGSSATCSSCLAPAIGIPPPLRHSRPSAIPVSFSGWLSPTDSCNVRRKECRKTPTSSLSWWALLCLTQRVQDEAARRGWWAPKEGRAQSGCQTLCCCLCSTSFRSCRPSCRPSESRIFKGGEHSGLGKG